MEPIEASLASDGSVFYLLLFIGVAAFIAQIYFYFSDQTPILAYTVPVPDQCSPKWHGEVLEQPKLKVSGSSAIQCYNPANGRSLGVVLPVSADGIDRAVAKAKEAQGDWASTTWHQRRTWLRTLKKSIVPIEELMDIDVADGEFRHILDNQETIVTASCLDSGKTRVDAYFGEVLVTLEKIDWMIKHGEASLRPERRPTNLLMCYKVNEVRWEPKGVVAACVSWNYPFHNLFSPIISSLFAGNAIVLKPSERTAWSSQYFVNIARSSLEACGHSSSLIQSCVCWPATAPHLVSHPDISHLTFIGSRQVAHSVAQSATKSLTELCLELGGKDPAIVLDDVAHNNSELERVVATLVRGVFQAAGQNCIGIERIIVQPKAYERLIAKLEPIVRALRCGDPAGQDNEGVVDVGAMISGDRFDELEGLVADAVSQGAKLLVGGRRLTHPHGHYFQPTLLVDVTLDMRVAQVELFAPIMVLMRTSTSMVEDAIAIANSAPYGLGASVFGRDTPATAHITREVKAGMIAINDFAAFYAVQLPFGGVGGSGYGRFAGKEGLRSVCNMKSFCQDRLPWLMKTAIPPALQIPYGGLDAKRNNAAAIRRAEETVRGVVELGYGDGWRRRVAGLRRIIGV